MATTEFTADVLATIRLIKPGEWSAPREIATAIGRPRAWRAVGNVIGPRNWCGTEEDRTYAVRVLHSDGRPSPGFCVQAIPGSGPETQVQMLAEQGVPFTRGRADATHLVNADTFTARRAEH